jgi:uncharacterized protein (DUF1015 family)
MAKVKPFAALRPHKDHAKEVSSPPFDAGSKEAAYKELQANPHSYLNVVKPYLHFKGEKKNVEKHFPLGLQYLKQFIAEGFLVKEEVPAFYIYRLIKGSQAYAGIIAAASVDDYLENRILKHENTLTEKQLEIAEHITFFNNLGNPVLLTYPDDQAIDMLIDQYILRHVPEFNFISTDQIKHNLWVVNDNADIALLESRFEAIEKLYIADGHHRSAGSASFCQQMRAKNPSYTGEESFNFFPVCLIPFSRITIFEYHRLVKDAGIVNDKAFLDKVKQYFEAIPSGHLPVQPLNKKELGIYFHKKAYLLKLKPEIAEKLEGPLANLDVSIAEQYLLKNIFDINDSKTDHRLSFMDGGKGIGHLQDAIDGGEFDLAITLYPTSIEEVKKVAEENLIMPPKSTWIEPKIRTGLIILDHSH